MVSGNRRFANDGMGFEKAFSRACAETGGEHKKRGLLKRALEKASRALQGAGGWLAGGTERVAVRRGTEWVRDGWVYVAPNDVWRFDTGGGKRILGIAGEVGKEARALILSKGEKGAEMAFRKMENGVGVLRVPEGEAGNGVLASMLAVAKGWIFEDPLQFSRWADARKGKRIVYDAHDVFLEASRGRGFGEEELERAERRLLEDAERVWFCTEADRTATQRRYADLDGTGWEVLPNGINVEEVGGAVVPSEARKKREAVGWSRPVVLFAGANYGPNYEAVDEISREWAPKHPEVTFVVLGMRIDRYLRDGGLEPAPNVVFTGLVSEEEKRVLYDLAEVAIVPVRRGTGSSLKVPEAIARGKVVIGTRVGLRGFEEWTKWESVVMSERGEDELGRVLERLEKDPGSYDAACHMAAEEMHRRYTWGALMERWKGTWGGKTQRKG